MFKTSAFNLSLVFVASLPALSIAETVRQHDSHEHGVSKLKIAIDNNEVQFILEAPGSDIVGFENKPKNKEQKAKVAGALEILSQPAKLFQLPAPARCSTTSVHTEFSLAEEPDTKIEHDEEGDHAEFNVTYLFECSSPDEFREIGIGYFDQFPNSKEIELQAISDFGQLSAEISNDQRIIDLTSIAE